MKIPDSYEHALPQPYSNGLLFAAFILVICVVTSCSTMNKVPTVNKKSFHPANKKAGQITAKIPNYRDELTSVKGEAKAIVSGPKKTNRVTLYFWGTHKRSLIHVKNTIGVEGAEILAFDDSLLIYNKVKKYVRKISVNHSNLHGINHLATLNLLKLINPVVKKSTVEQVSENETKYLLDLQSGGSVLVNKKTYLVQQITQPKTAGMAYSKIIYQGYGQIEGLTLPRRITIFSADHSTRIDLLVKSLKVNPPLNKLTIHLPDDIKVYHR